MNIEGRLKQHQVDAVTGALDKIRDELVRISLDIHSHPELNYQEHYSSAVLAAALEDNGFVVERGIGGVETAFRATVEGAGDGVSGGWERLRCFSDSPQLQRERRSPVHHDAPGWDAAHRPGRADALAPGEARGSHAAQGRQ